MSIFHRAVPILLAVAVAACADLTAPTLDQSAEQAAAPPKPAEAQRPATPKPRPSARPQRPNQAPEGESVEAAHVLIAHKEARRSKTDRTKEDARKLAGEIAAKAKKGDDFGKLAQEFSDDPGSKARGGMLGRFTRKRMVKPFADAAFELKPGQISGVVETAFGFHVIKRTK